MLLGHHLHTAFKLQVVFMSYFWNWWPGLLLLSFFFNVTASENKLASLPCEYLPVSFCCLSAAFLSFSKLETCFAEEDWVFRENKLQPSSQKQERREVFSAHQSPCCILVLGKVQAGNWALLLLLITELVSQFSFPHALSLPSGLS